MDTTILAALIGLAGIVLGTVLKAVLEHHFARAKAKREQVPDIVGRWQTKWFVEKEGKESPYSESTVVIEKQHGFDVFGKGSDWAGTYLMTGKFSHGFLTFFYEFEKALDLAFTGVVILKRGAFPGKWEGRWYGYTARERIEGGRVLWN